MAEAGDLKSLQCGFESRRGHVTNPDIRICLEVVEQSEGFCFDLGAVVRALSHPVEGISIRQASHRPRSIRLSGGEELQMGEEFLG
jgi:hypothetical protein